MGIKRGAPVKRVTWLIVLSMLAPGCAPIDNSLRTVLFEPHHYWHYWDEHRRLKHHRKLGRQVFAGIVSEEGDCYSADFADGFVEGFADYLFAGGTGEPPAFPPRRYWKETYANASGQQAVQDWFSGFRYGAEMAMVRGDREHTVLAYSGTGWGYLAEPYEHFGPQTPGLPLESLPSPGDPGEIIESGLIQETEHGATSEAFVPEVRPVDEWSGDPGMVNQVQVTPVTHFAPVISSADEKALFLDLRRPTNTDPAFKQ